MSNGNIAIPMTWLMLGTAIAFIPYALLYRPRTYLQD